MVGTARTRWVRPWQGSRVRRGSTGSMTRSSPRSRSVRPRSCSGFSRPFSVTWTGPVFCVLGGRPDGIAGTLAPSSGSPRGFVSSPTRDTHWRPLQRSSPCETISTSPSGNETTLEKNAIRLATSWRKPTTISPRLTGISTGYTSRLPVGTVPHTTATKGEVADSAIAPMLTDRRSRVPWQVPATHGLRSTSSSSRPGRRSREEHYARLDPDATRRPRQAIRRWCAQPLQAARDPARAGLLRRPRAERGVRRLPRLPDRWWRRQDVCCGRDHAAPTRPGWIVRCAVPW